MNTTICRRFAGALLVVLCSPLIIPRPLAAQDWLQWGRTPQHRGAAPIQGQRPEAILDSLVYDPFVEQMKAETGGLLAHYSVPLIRQGAIYMVFKSGAYTGLGNFDSIDWSVKKLEWIDGRLEAVWTFETDWKPEPLALTGWESVLLPAISGHDIYVPGLGGTVFRVATETGISEGRVNPFGEVDPNRYVAGGLAVAPDGSVLYNVVDLAADPAANAEGAWLVRVVHEVDASRVAWSTLVTSAPGANDLCQSQFPTDQRPWPPSPTAVPPTVACGSQRPGINVVPAVAEDGTIYTLSRAHGSDRYAYLVAVHPDLTRKWSVSLRGILNDGCGVLVPIDDSVRGCRAGTTHGVDPATNDQPAGRVSDRGTASPVVLPDGNILVGASTAYNYSRGHLFKFSADGDVLATYDFGWDITPAVFEHDGTYSIVIKDNHYSSTDGTDFYDVTTLDANLEPVWSFRATNTESCVRQPDGHVECVDDHPEGFEWCVNQPVIDVDGTAYLNSEDGVLYAFDREGHVVGDVFLDTALGAAYTPLSLGPNGVIYTQNNGVLFAVGAAPSVPPEPRGTPEPPATRVHATRVLARP